MRYHDFSLFDFDDFERKSTADVAAEVRWYLVRDLRNRTEGTHITQFDDESARLVFSTRPSIVAPDSNA